MSRPVDYAMLTDRRCSRCKEMKPIAEFGRFTDATAVLTGWRYYSRCKDCNKSDCRDYGAKSKPVRNARLRSWRIKNPEKAAQLDRRKRLSDYGLTESDVTAMHDAQNGCCKLCDREVSLVIDHCHLSGRVRGLLCNRCNTTLGWVEGHPKILERVSAYIDKPCHADILLECANAE